MIVYHGDSSYSTYTFTYSNSYYSYSKVFTSTSGSTTTATGTFTPTFTYTSSGSLSTISLTFDDSSYFLVTFSYYTNGLIRLSTKTSYSDSNSISASFYIGTAHSSKAVATINK